MSSTACTAGLPSHLNHVSSSACKADSRSCFMSCERHSVHSRLAVKNLTLRSSTACQTGGGFANVQARYQSAHHPGLVVPMLALAAIELRQNDTASWQRYVVCTHTRMCVAHALLGQVAIRKGTAHG